MATSAGWPPTSLADKGETINVTQVPFERLEELWRPLLSKFAGWNIGLPREDLYQELLLVLWRAQTGYSPDKGASFQTYLYTALLNKVGTLNHRLNGTKSRVPTSFLVPLCDGLHSREERCGICGVATATDDVSAIDALSALRTKDLHAVMRAYAERKPDQIKKARSILKKEGIVGA